MSIITIRIRMMAGCLALGISALSAVAQMPAGMKMGPAAGTLVEPSKAVDAQLSQLEKEMMGVVNKMPAEKYGFAPSKAIFVSGQTPEFTKVRTFAEQAAHVADANYNLLLGDERLEAGDRRRGYWQDDQQGGCGGSAGGRRLRLRIRRLRR